MGIYSKKLSSNFSRIFKSCFHSLLSNFLDIFILCSD